jgi:hypothetical protein
LCEKIVIVGGFREEKNRSEEKSPFDKKIKTDEKMFWENVTSEIGSTQM